MKTLTVNDLKKVTMKKEDIVKKLKDLGVYSKSMDVIINQLVDVSSTIELLNEGVKQHGAVYKTKVAEGHERIMVNPAVMELTKQQTVKVKLLEQLLLTPQSLNKSGVEVKKNDGWDDIVATK